MNRIVTVHTTVSGTRLTVDAPLSGEGLVSVLRESEAPLSSLDGERLHPQTSSQSFTGDTVVIGDRVTLTRAGEVVYESTLLAGEVA